MTAPTLLHHLLDGAAAGHPDRPALTCGSRTYSYAGLAEASNRLAAWLRGHGLVPGDRVLVALPPDASVAPLVYAASRAGVVFVVVHPDVRGAVLRHIATDCEPRLIVADDPEWKAAPGATVVSAADLADAATAPLAGGGGTGPAVLAVDPACLIYTSGSTAMPKAVACTHAQMVFAATAIAGELRYRMDDVVYVALPLSFDYGLYQLFLAALAGAHLWLGGTAGPGLVGELAAAGATVLPAVPGIAETLARMLPRATRGAVPPLRLLTNTGATMPPATLSRLRNALPGLGVQLMFGLTECKRIAIMPVDGDLRRPGSCGRPLPGTAVEVVDEDGHPLPPGQTGELVVRGPHVMSGYWRRPDLTAQRFERRDGLFPRLRTGDYGHLDADGYLYFEGRRDDLYKSRGFRVSTVEVEAAALRLDGVRAAAVLPPDAGRREAVLLVATDLDAGSVLRGLRAELEDAKVPAVCVPLPELPTGGNGKVDKRALAALVGKAGHGAA